MRKSSKVSLVAAGLALVVAPVVTAGSAQAAAVRNPGNSGGAGSVTTKNPIYPHAPISYYTTCKWVSVPHTGWTLRSGFYTYYKVEQVCNLGRR